MSEHLHRAVQAFALLVTAILTSCGSGEASSNPDGGGGCGVIIGISPSNPMVPTELVATANVSEIDGVVDFFWSAEGPDGPIDPTVRAPDGSEVGVTADTPGPYTISVTVEDIDGSCADSTTVNVLPGGGATAQLVLRFAPPDDGVAPPRQQGEPFTIYEDTDWNVGTLTLTAGKTIAGALTGPDGPLAAYLRLATPDFTTEFFSSGTGAYQVLVLDRAAELYDVTVVPYEPTVAPDRLALAASDLEAGIFLDRGDPVDGVVVDSTGAAVAGATVAIAAGNLPASVVTTDIDGHFAAPVRAAAGSLSIAVVPPAASTLPRLELTEAAGVSPPAGELLTVTLGDVPLATVGGLATISGGAPLAGARMTYAATAPATGGTVQIGAGAPVDAPFAARVTVVADATGVVPAVSLPFGIYDVMIDVPVDGFDGQGPALGALDLTGGAPPSPPVWSTAAEVPRALHVMDGVGSAVAGARVTAIALGLAGVGAGVATSDVTAASGDVTLALVPGMGYDLIVDPPRDVALSRARLRVAAADPWPASIALGAAITIRGTVVYPPSGVGEPGVRVEAVCSPCGAGEDSEQPLGETSTGAGGTFSLAVPSP